MARHPVKLAERPGLVLTPRDIAVIRAVYRYRFLSTDQIQLLTGTTSRSKLNSRLRELWGNDYLDRPEYQRERRRMPLMPRAFYRPASDQSPVDSASDASADF